MKLIDLAYMCRIAKPYWQSYKDWDFKCNHLDRNYLITVTINEKK